MVVSLEAQAENLAHKIQYYLISNMGRVLSEASAEEFYRAFSYTLREEVLINWSATAKGYAKKKNRMLYYFSMEYLPGRILSNNITSLHSCELVARILKQLNRSVSQVYACERDPGLGNGGLGRLASCFLDSMATQQYPAQGYGLRYQYGIFEQELREGIQIERPDCWLLNENPWEFRRDEKAQLVKFCGRTVFKENVHHELALGICDHEEVRALPYDIPIIGYREDHDFSVNTLRLWSTKESPRNFMMQRYNSGQLGQASENTTLTDVLYPNDDNDVGKRIRLKQEFLLVSASLQDIIRYHQLLDNNVNKISDKVRIQINDTHPALAIAEMVRLLIARHDFSWKKAWETTQEIMSYTNHTILREALEMWNQGRMRYLLPRQYAIIEHLNHDFCSDIRKAFPNDEERVRRMSIIEDGQVRMAHLAIYGSHRVNGVAALHTKILKNKVFKDFYEMFPDRFVNVTNGVTQRRWLLHCNSGLATFITKRLGKEWITDFKQIRRLADYAKDEESLNELMQIKLKNKQALASYLEKHNILRDYGGNVVGLYPSLDCHSIFDVQVKRIHEYKRQLMNILHAIMLYYELLENPNSRKVSRTIIIGGKAAAGYVVAKNIIRLIHCVARRVNNDPAINGQLRIIYAENYNVSKAEMIIPAVDLSEQISTAGMEASGTGNMKMSMNGALTIGTDDGANIEMREEVKDQWWPFGFGCSLSEIEQMKADNSYDPWMIYGEYPKIRNALESLRDQSFVKTNEEHEALSELYHNILEGDYGGCPDRYLVLKDLPAYHHTQKKVEELYLDQKRWAEYVMHNIAGMSSFSADVSIENYAEKIWDLNKGPPDPLLLDEVRTDFTKHDKCRILAF